MSTPKAQGAPIRIIVMGVSGSGKSSVGSALAVRLGLPFIEGDALHSARNIEKMSAGAPLDDDDRWPWLDAIAERLRESERGAVASCSALKRIYRERLRVGVGPGLRFLYLAGNADLMAKRMTSRKGHFMRPKMLESQLATLEPPIHEAGVLVRDASQPIDEIVEAATTACKETGEQRPF